VTPAFTHPDDASLQAFLSGDLDDPAAVDLALHLDDCPRCAARAASVDSLSSAFAASTPPPPPGLAAATLAAARAPARPGPELGIGLTLLCLAAGLLLLAGPPPALPAWGGLPVAGLVSAPLALGAVAGLFSGLAGALFVLRRPAARVW